MKPIEKRFTKAKIKVIKENLQKDNEEQLIYYCMDYHNALTNAIGLTIMVIFVVASRAVGNNLTWPSWICPLIGVLLGAVAYFVILVLVSIRKRKFYYKHRDEILEYVRGQIKKQ